MAVFVPPSTLVLEGNSKNIIVLSLPSFKLKFSLGFITSCYVIFNLSMVQAMDIFMII